MIMNIAITVNSKPSSLSALVHDLKTCVASGETEITVRLDAGQYLLTEPIRLLGKEIGNRAKIHFVCEEREKAMLCGWVPVTGFSKTTVNGVEAWEADMPIIGEELLNAHQFFSASYERLERPRYPKTGYLYPAGLPGYENSDNPFLERSIWGKDNDIFHNRTDAFYFHPGEYPMMTHLQDMQIRMFHYWINEKMTVDAIDYEKNLITFKNPALYLLGSEVIDENGKSRGGRYFFDNVYEMLNTPGQVYEDRERGKLLYIPRAGESPEDCVIYASNIEQLMIIDGMDHLRFENIAFVGSDWKNVERSKEVGAQQAAADITNNAVTVDNASHLTFTDCAFMHIGNYAFHGLQNIHDLTVDHCVFRDLGAGGFWIEGVRRRDEQTGKPVPEAPSDIRITNNLFSDYGRVFADAVGIFFQYAYDVLIAHNELCHAPYSGIHLGWSWSPEYAWQTAGYLVEKNLVYDIGMGMMSDAGGIYTNGVLENTVIRGNVVYDVKMAEGGYGGWGIYMDAYTGGMTVEKNIVYDCSQEAFNSSQGKGNLIRNNIFAFGATGSMSDRSSDGNCAFSLERNIIVTDFAPVYRFNPDDRGQTCFKDDSNLLWDYTLHTAYSCINGNLLEIGDVDEIRARVDENIRHNQEQGYYQNILITDPMFRDPQNRDFTLLPASPAFRIGFEPIATDDVGICPKK